MRLRPALLFGIRLWASVTLALWAAFALELQNPFWAATSAAIVCQPALGASLRKGWFRLVGTAVGAVAIVAMTAAFPQNRGLFLLSLALWSGACGFAATLLRNFAAYAASLAGFTAAVIASDQLGPVGGLNGQVLLLALDRAVEIGIGIVSAGIVLAGTDLGGARQRLAGRLARLLAGIAAQQAATLRRAGPELPDMREARRAFIREVAALDPAIDEAVGESTEIRQRAPALQAAIDGLFTTLGSWRAIATHLLRLPHEQAREEARAVLEVLPAPMRDPGAAAGWPADPAASASACRAASARLRALPTASPSLRLLADRAAASLDGLAAGLGGLALLAGEPDPAPPGLGLPAPLRVPDWLPAWVNGARCFAATAAAALFWIVTAWPGGAGAVTWATITMTLFAPRLEQAYPAALNYTLGTLVACVFAAIWGFALLPALPSQNFAVLAACLALYLIPAGALMTQPWRQGMFTAMAVNFLPLLQPANPMVYNVEPFYNSALTIVGGIGAAMLTMRLLPPLSAAQRTRRLLGLSLRDVRRLAAGAAWRDWSRHLHGRLAACPPEATRLEHAELLAALSAGREMIRLRALAGPLGFAHRLEGGLACIAEGDSERAAASLGALADSLAAERGAEPDGVRARAALAALQDVLHQHAGYFDARLPA